MSDQSFDPTRHLTQLRGRGGPSDYLEVKWRLVWLRDKHPDAHLETEFSLLDEKIAVVRATITVPNGGSATGIGSETPGDFKDYIEKAETKAIGRALAALGFGTQFCEDHSFGADAGRVVDSPVNRRPTTRPAPDATPASDPPPTPSPRGKVGYATAPQIDAAIPNGTPIAGDPTPAAEPDAKRDDNQPISQNLINAIWTNAAQHGIKNERVIAAVRQNFGGRDIGSLTRGEARRVIADITTARTP